MNIIIIGDVMIDINYYSEVYRNAPESIEIPIYNVENSTTILGGASNVAVNLQNLGGNIELISVVGNDNYGLKIKSMLEEKEIKHTLFLDKKRKTTQKNRIFCNSVLVTRYDIEDTHIINENLSSKIFDYVKKKENINAIIISDYDKGVVSEELCIKLVKYANEHNIFTFIDPKLKNYEKYKDCFCLKPNLNEGEIITGEKEYGKILEKIKKKINCKNVVLTCGNEGIFVNNITNHICHKERIDVIDVTGSGDIVLSLLVYIFLKTNDLVEASKIANYIAGKGVKVLGNYNVSLLDIDNYYNSSLLDIDNCYNSLKYNKIIYDHDIERIKYISKMKNIVFTNGCFDIIHSAHIKNLQFAKQQGDILVVGLNSDISIKRLKGDNRPINTIEERSLLLSLFEFVDYIIIFDEDTPLNIIKLLKPTIMVKGSDYEQKNIVGNEYVDKIILFEYINNKSTSLIIEKIKNLQNT